jgi:transcription antitermination factor NusG
VSNESSIVDGEENSGPAPWFGIQTKPKAEKVAAVQLEVRGYHVFLPLLRKYNKWSDRVVQIDCALFPGYLFCRLNPRLPPIVAVRSVVLIVGRGRQPEPIPEHEISNVQNMLQSGLMVTPHPYLRIGDRVTIVKGPLCGVDGLIVKNKAKCKIVVSINLLQRSVAVELDSDAVCEEFGTHSCTSQSPSRRVSASCS